jgi:hypothetical protein
MIKNPPLNQSIENIQGENVIFKGQTPEQELEPDENKKVVAQMAKNAMQ